MPVRPKSIVQFELVYFAIIVLGLVNTALSWNDMIASISVQRMIAQIGVASVYITAFVGIAIQLLLWYFVARRGSVIAKWIFVIFYGLGILWSCFAFFTSGGAVSTLVALIGIVLLVLQAVAIFLLFRPDTPAWFGESATVA